MKEVALGLIGHLENKDLGETNDFVSQTILEAGFEKHKFRKRAYELGKSILVPNWVKSAYGPSSNLTKVTGAVLTYLYESGFL